LTEESFSIPPKSINSAELNRDFLYEPFDEKSDVPQARLMSDCITVDDNAVVAQGEQLPQ
jgi:hypothetical protein